MLIEEEAYLAHYGVLRRSGRYPWGSGGNVEHTPPRNMTFLDQIGWLKSRGLSDSQIAQGFGMSSSRFRAVKSIESNEQKQANISFASGLKEKGTSNTEISRRMNVPESTVRSWLAPGAKDKADILSTTTKMLKKEVDDKTYVDIGKGVEQHIGVSKTRLDTAIAVLKEQGYSVHQVKLPQLTTVHDTNGRILVPPGVTQKDVFLNTDKIQLPTNWSADGGRTYSHIHEPIKLDPKRIGVVTKEDGGAKADGMMYVRPGVTDISLGDNQYAQVRVAVGNDHYLKGMAIYKEGLPAGTDVQFHTSKSDTGNKLDAMKKNSDEKGFSEKGPHVLLKSVKRQIIENADTPNERVTSAMNIVNEDGDWATWSRNLSSQMLSKQSPVLAKSQLAMTYERRTNELDAINKLTNPTVRKKLLMDFADSTDSAAVHLKAAALPKTIPHVILPISTIKPNEIFAPNYKDGDRVVLIRHPHGGTFEIPELVVNNKNKEARALIGTDSRTAVGIHHETAQRLSGADFDGDTVLVIPNNAGAVRHSHALDELKNFDPRSSYPAYDGMKPMRNTQKEMGQISNLITDMSLQGAPHADIARAVKHSMVVIDAEKHNLNHRQSYKDNGIKQLQAKYQPNGGASTIISRARSDQRIPERKPRTAAKGGPIDKQTGALAFEPTGRNRLTRTTKLAETHDARTLLSSPTGTPIERLYANHSNSLKALANKARLSAIKTPALKQSPSAKKVYHKEVASLNSKLTTALKNAPLERQAQLIATTMVRARRQDNPGIDDDTLKKIKTQCLTTARARTGARKTRVEVTPEEWNAIQAGAISNSKLTEILKNANMDTIRAHATPKSAVLMTTSKTARAKQMLASGYTRAEVAAHLGVSLTTLDRATVD